MVEFPAFCYDDGLEAPPRAPNEIGTLLPIAPCGRSSLSYLRQASNFSCASASVRNQCAFKHSARKRSLNAPMNALSVGLPGRKKSNVTLFAWAHRSVFLR